jgi:MFS family permease
MKDTIHHEHEKHSIHLPTIPESIRFEFLTASFIGVFAWAMAGFFMVVAPTFVTTLVHINNLAVAGAVVCLMLGASAITQILLKRMALQKAIFTGFGLLIIGVVCVSISIPTHALWLLLMSTLATGAGHGPTSSASLHHASEIAPRGSKADAISSYYAFAYLGVSVPVLGLGFIAEWIGIYHGILVFAVVIIAALLVLSRFVVLMSKDKQLPVQT